LIGATTRAGLMTSPMRARFGIIHNLDFYSQADLLKILHRNAALLNMNQGDDDGGDDAGDSTGVPIPAKTRLSLAALTAIAQRSRGTPRIANRLLRRVRDYAQVKTGGRLAPAVVDAALQLEGVDELGLDELDRKYLRVIADVYQGGPVGLEAVAATLGEDSGTLEDVVEPYLLQIGFLARTRKGRQLTLAGAERVGLKIAPPALGEGLFEGGEDEED